MKAYILAETGTGAGTWRLVSRADPSPGPGEVLVAIRAAALNPRDVAIAGGVPFHPKRDLVPLSDGAGDVLAVGAGVSRPAVGERVMGAFYQGWIAGPPPKATEPPSDLGHALDGVLAERAIFRAAAALPIPAHLSYEEAATLPSAAVTAWHALMESQPPHKPGATLLTLGSGGVSLFAFQLAKVAGLRVIGTTSSAARANQLRALGFDHVIDYNANPEWQDEVRDVTGGYGVDQVIEVAGVTLPRSLRAVKRNGLVSVIGGAGGWDAQVSLEAIIEARARIIPIFVGSAAMFAAMNRAIAAHRLRPIIDRVYAFDHAADAFAHQAGGAHLGKIVIRV
jgi:NADPH:quinone reductase-like Zn-dependent oxidoreductase